MRSVEGICFQTRQQARFCRRTRPADRIFEHESGGRRAPILQGNGESGVWARIVRAGLRRGGDRRDAANASHRRRHCRHPVPLRVPCADLWFCCAEQLRLLWRKLNCKRLGALGGALLHEPSLEYDQRWRSPAFRLERLHIRAHLRGDHPGRRERSALPQRLQQRRGRRQRHLPGAAAALRQLRAHYESPPR